MDDILLQFYFERCMYRLRVESLLVKVCGPLCGRSPQVITYILTHSI